MYEFLVSVWEMSVVAKISWAVALVVIPVIGITHLLLLKYSHAEARVVVDRAMPKAVVGALVVGIVLNVVFREDVNLFINNYLPWAIPTL